MARRTPDATFALLLTVALVGCNLDFSETPLETPSMDTGDGDTALDGDAAMVDTRSDDTAVGPDSRPIDSANDSDAPDLCGDCPSGTACCGGNTCLSLADDPENCGRCGVVCGSGVCSEGACCAPATCDGLGVECGRHDDGCGGTVTCAPCPTGTMCDPGGACVSTTTPFRVPDTATQYCVEGASPGAPCPAQGDPYYGQDGNYRLRLPDYEVGADGLVVDNVTGLEWHPQRAPVASLAEGETHCASLAPASAEPWRMPTLFELITLVDYGKPQFNYDESVFGAGIDETWLSNVTDGGALMGFSTPGGAVAPRTAGVAFCVRGETPPRTWTMMGASIAVDEGLGLMWTRFGQGLVSWEGALTSCESLSLGGFDDWRLPNVKVLSSLLVRDPVDGTARIDDTVFSLGGRQLWSSTPDGENSQTNGVTEIRLVDTMSGDLEVARVGNGHGHLCVRDVEP